MKYFINFRQNWWGKVGGAIFHISYPLEKRRRGFPQPYSYYIFVILLAASFLPPAVKRCCLPHNSQEPCPTCHFTKHFKRKRWHIHRQWRRDKRHTAYIIFGKVLFAFANVLNDASSLKVRKPIVCRYGLSIYSLSWSNANLLQQSSEMTFVAYRLPLTSKGKNARIVKAIKRLTW